MAARHLVTWLNATLDGHIDLDNFEHARCQVVALGQLAFLVFEALFHFLPAAFQLSVGLGQQLVERLILQAQLEPLLTRQLFQIAVGEHVALFQLGAPIDGLAGQGALETLESRIFSNTVGLLQVLAHFIELHLLDGQRTGILLHTVAGKDLYVDDGTAHSGRGSQ